MSNKQGEESSEETGSEYTDGEDGEEYESSSEEEDEDGEEEEPKLKYMRLGSNVIEILKEDSATCMAVHEKFLV
jgi:vacuolar protein sorting-associated protein 41